MGTGTMGIVIFALTVNSATKSAISVNLFADIFSLSISVLSVIG